MSKQAAHTALGGFTSSCCPWGWRHHPACSDSDPLPEAHSRGRAPAHPMSTAPEMGSTQLGPLCPAATKLLDAPPMGTFPVKTLSQRS